MAEGITPLVLKTAMEEAVIEAIKETGIHEREAPVTIATLIGFLVIVGTWMAGFVLASGWMKLVCVIPFYSWYLVVERLMQMGGII